METVADLFARVSKRFDKEPPVQGFLDAVGHVVKHIDTRLFRYGSDLLHRDVSTVFGIGVASRPLPTGFMGLVTDPVMVDSVEETVTVLNLLPPTKRWTFFDNDTPKYFDLRDTRIHLFPTPDEAVTVCFVAMTRNAIESMNEEIPYNGLFNDLIAELALKFSNNPTMAATDPTIQYLIAGEMDAIVQRRKRKDIHFKYRL